MNQDMEPTLAFGFMLVNLVVAAGNFALDDRVNELGQKDNALILMGELWRFITPIFLHYGIFHLAINSYSLIVIGPRVERAYGHGRFLAIYLLSGLAGVVASFAMNPAYSAGSSGAIFGLLGALLPLYLRNPSVYGDFWSWARPLLSVIGVNLVFSLLPEVDGWAHLGGLIAGLAVGWIATPLYRVVQDSRGMVHYGDISSNGIVWTIITGIGVVIGGLAYLAMIDKGF